jgi:hypothetical protein
MTAPAQVTQDVMFDLGRLIDALGQYREVAILTGGFVPVMYRRVPRFVEPPTPSLLTTDFDWTVPAPLDVLGGQSLADRLADSRFVTISSIGTEPPVQRFQHERFGTRTLAPVHAEFLAPLVGSEVDRKGTSKTVVTVQRGLTAQALRYLDLLFIEPLPFDAGTVPELGLAAPTTILLPNPATYVAQKLLAWPERDPKKRDKDLAYIHEVAFLTQAVWPELAVVVNDLKTRFPAPWFKRVSELTDRLFKSAPAEGAIAILRQYEGILSSVPSEKAVRKVMVEFFRAVGLAL